VLTCRTCVQLEAGSPFRNARQVSALTPEPSPHHHVDDEACRVEAAKTEAADSSLELEPSRTLENIVDGAHADVPQENKAANRRRELDFSLEDGVSDTRTAIVTDSAKKKSCANAYAGEAVLSVSKIGMFFFFSFLMTLTPERLQTSGKATKGDSTTWSLTILVVRDDNRIVTR
jgi:hypothetical protein